MERQIIILAAGHGSRMKSDLPKVMHEINGTPMIEMVLSSAAQVTSDIVLVHSLQLEKYLPKYQSMCKLALQPAPLGTAHAAYVALDLIDDKKDVAILYGDNPLITSDIIHSLFNHMVNTNSALTTLCFIREEHNQYGRIVTDANDEFLKIVEFKEATNEELAIKLCNSGIMVFKAGILRKYLNKMFLNPIDGIEKEIYLTSIVEIAKDNREKISYMLSPDHAEVVGVNTKQELEEANNIIKMRSK